jgi:S-adenosylmethionine:tRNA ribosyltransferase-isomerase
MSAVALPSPREAHEPPEARGLGRQDVSMLVCTRADGTLVDTRFAELPQFLAAGDLLVVNTSATLPAALHARLEGNAVELRLSTELDDALWAVELRDAGARRMVPAAVGARIDLPGGAHAEVLSHYLGGDRLQVVRLVLGAPLIDYLHGHGRPISYGHVHRSWPMTAHQTVFAREPGSAEMPSAGRPFTSELVTELIAAGVLVAPLTLHTGVSSLERGESPYPERFEVPDTTARLVNSIHAWGGRVIAVGTTVARALETVAEPGGAVRAGKGWTPLVITPERGLWAIDGLLSGWHETDSSHLALLAAAAGSGLLAESYRAAEALGYLGHEFGDVHLILP